MSLRITTGSDCPTASTVTASATLTSHQDVALTIQRDDFFGTDTVYYGIKVYSPNDIPVSADVLNVTINGIAFTEWTSISAANGFHGGFSLSLTSNAFALAGDNSKSFVIGATIKATFDGQKRKREIKNIALRAVDRIQIGQVATI